MIHKRSSLLVSKLEAVFGAMQPASGPAWVSSLWVHQGPLPTPQGAGLKDRQACPHWAGTRQL